MRPEIIAGPMPRKASPLKLSTLASAAFASAFFVSAFFAASAGNETASRTAAIAGIRREPVMGNPPCSEFQQPVDDRGDRVEAGVRVRVSERGPARVIRSLGLDPEPELRGPGPLLLLAPLVGDALPP